MTVGSCVLGVISVTATWLALKKHARLAAWVLLGSQPLNMAYDCYTRQYGWVAMALVTIGLAVRTLRET